MRRVRLFYPTGSRLHRLHPSTKLVVFAACILVLAVLPWRLNGPLVLLLVAALVSSGVPFAHYALIIILSLPVMVISPVLNMFWPPDPATNHVIGVFAPLGWPIYAEGLRVGVDRDLWIGGSMIVTIILLTTTDLPDLADAPTYLGLPHVIGFTFAATLRYIPEVSNFLLTLYDVQESRGVDFYTRNPIVNFARRTNILIPVLVFQLSRANRMSNAMESRGFQIRHTPTLYALRPMTGAERACMWAVSAVTVVLLALRVYTVFVPGDYPLEFGTF
jgi:energy-coupling factor transport system permease protein